MFGMDAPTGTRPQLAHLTAQIDEMMALIRRCLDLTLADVVRNGWA